MTNEEAIKVLQTYDMSEDNEDKEFIDAVVMAIKALEQEPVLGKIRAEIIENSIEEYKYFGCGSKDLIIDTSSVLETIDKYRAESEAE